MAFKAAAVQSGSSGIDRWKSMARSLPLWGGIASFAAEFVVWLALLSLIPLSQAILIGSINIVTVVVAGRLLFRERLDANRIAAISLIAIGVSLAGVAT
jgi:drug/metabolite transporter (DMT)-like permease